MAEKEKLTIKTALELLQKIRYYNSEGNIVFLMDESEEIDYISAICKKYEGTPKQIVKKMRIANILESMGIINTNNSNRNKQTNSENALNTNTLRPLIKIRRRNNYTTKK
jgi:Cdc6-like AAA superfamily ATPase